MRTFPCACLKPRFCQVEGSSQLGTHDCSCRTCCRQMNEKKWLRRIIFLETVAGVPGASVVPLCTYSLAHYYVRNKIRQQRALLDDPCSGRMPSTIRLARALGSSDD